MIYALPFKSILVVFEHKKVLNDGTVVCSGYYYKIGGASKAEFHVGKQLRDGEEVTVRHRKQTVRMRNSAGMLEVIPVVREQRPDPARIHGIMRRASAS